MKQYASCGSESILRNTGLADIASSMARELPSKPLGFGGIGDGESVFDEVSKDSIFASGFLRLVNKRTDPARRSTPIIAVAKIHRCLANDVFGVVAMPVTAGGTPATIPASASARSFAEANLCAG